MFRRTQELWYSLIAIAVVTAVYLVAYMQASSFPAASSLVGHGIGILGFVLMLMAETLYSIRKQLTEARWGSMAGWLRFHIVTGLVGPYMVLLHTAMAFHGLAGVAMLLTVVVVISGAIGRYIYTAVPRSIDEGEHELTRLDGGVARVEAPPIGSAGLGTASAVALASSSGSADSPRTPPAGGPRSSARRFQRLTTERGALATWYSIHVPLTWALFVTAFVHVVAALYYATLQR